MSLPGLDKYIPLVFDHIKVDSDVSDFVALIWLSANSSGIGDGDSSCVFDEVGANWQKTALATNADIETYVEKVSWDDTGETAELHGKVSLSSAADTTYKYWYDNDHADNTTYIKAQGDATSVWDSDFKLVAHMNDLTTSTIEDSTSNSHDITKVGANTPVEATGQIGKGQDFDVTNDYASIANHADFDFAAGFTLEAWANPDTVDYSGRLFYRYDAGSTDGYYLTQVSTGSGEWNFAVLVGGSNVICVSDAVPSGSAQHIAGVRAADGSCTLYVNGVAQADTETLSGAIDSNGILYIGQDMNNANRFAGIIDEARISGAARSAAWIKASYNSGNDSLITFGSEEEAETFVPLIIMF